MKITVLGSGHGGFAMSSDLKYSGYDVVLSSIAPHNSKLKLFKSLGQIKIEGMTEKYKNSVIIPTNFIEENTIKAIKRADIIMVNIPAFAKKHIMNLLQNLVKLDKLLYTLVVDFLL